MVQNPWVLVEGMFGRGLKRAFVIVDWNFLVVNHSRNLSRIVWIVVGGGIVRARVVSMVPLVGLTDCEVFVK
ncbi:hypothetical protein Tco_0638050 [Tanacetum coccineum]